MAAIAGMAFFAAALALAVWTIVDTVRPRLARILFLLEYGPVIGVELPPAPPVKLRGRPVPMRVSVPQRLRAAA